jgi:S1-C subfamily serine protease
MQYQPPPELELPGGLEQLQMMEQMQTMMGISDVRSPIRGMSELARGLPSPMRLQGDPPNFGVAMPGHAGLSRSSSNVHRRELSGLPLDSSIKIFTSFVAPNYAMPWQKRPQGRCTGSGFAISGGERDRSRMILTNSHVVHNHTSVRVQRYGRPGKYDAEVVCEGLQCDLALLVVDSDDFWQDLPTVLRITFIVRTMSLRS